VLLRLEHARRVLYDPRARRSRPAGGIYRASTLN
jgi:hypothetical protein